MQSVSFTIPGKPVGYTIIAGKFYGGKRKTQYLNYKKLVQALLPPTLRGLTATRERPVLILTQAYFENGTHPDPENVHKGIKDAIFYKAEGGDKYTGGTYWAPHYDKQNPRVVVTVEWDHG